jgi:hypothetical protein
MRGAEVFGIGTGNQAKEERRGEERRGEESCAAKIPRVNKN